MKYRNELIQLLMYDSHHSENDEKRIRWLRGVVENNFSEFQRSVNQVLKKSDFKLIVTYDSDLAKRHQYCVRVLFDGDSVIGEASSQSIATERCMDQLERHVGIK